MSSQLKILLTQAIQAFQGGNLQRADSILQRILLVDSKNAQALHILGLIKAFQKNYKEATNFLGSAALIQPNDPYIRYNLAKSLFDNNNPQDSIFHFKKVVELTPNNADAWLMYGRVLNDLNQHKAALLCYDKALKLQPNYAEAWFNKGITLNKLKQYDDAVACFDQSISLKPDYAEAWSNKGITLNELKQYDEAITHYDKALSLKPDTVNAWMNKGITLFLLKRYNEAVEHYDKALSLNPEYAECWSNKANTLHELKQFDEAITHYDKALSLKPDIAWVLGDLLHTKMKICEWSTFTDSQNKLIKKVMANETVINPFTFLALNDDALLHKKATEIYAQAKYPTRLTPEKIANKSGGEKIRIGYFSADFGNHAVSILTAELFELHDKNQFEIFAISYGADDKSSMRDRLINAFTQFIDVRTKSDQEIAKLARDLEIDIAVDLGGHTSGGRTGIFAYRAAPIQLSYIGYLGTMGIEYYDYLLADKIIIPNGSEHFFKEKIAYLSSYQVNDRKRAISNRQFTRGELGLPEKAFVFCCFNNNYKILPSTFDSWMRILNTVEGSVLFLYAENEWSRVNLINEAGLRGIDSARLIFGGRIPNEEYLVRYQVCDLFLDTFPYNAGTTASDALWAGLPVLTRMGQSFASRMAASLLNAVGLPELITNTREEYEALAIELVLNPNKLADIKLKLANNLFTTPLFDTPLFTKNLEAAYIKMYERYQVDLEPDHIFIT